MPVIWRTRLVLAAAGLTLSLMLIAGVGAADHAQAAPGAIFLLKQGATSPAVEAGFSTSPRRPTASPETACTKGTHVPDPKLT